MAKFYGQIGFVEIKETRPGVYNEVVKEESYRGDILTDTRRHESSENLNDDINISNTISIIANDHLYQKVFAIRYVKWLGVRWKVKDISVEPPRLRLTVGGVYNGTESESEEATDAS